MSEPISQSVSDHAGELAITAELSSLLSLALFEDVGSGDVTSLAAIPAKLRGEGRLFSKASGVLCGCNVARRVARLVDPRIKIDFQMKDGAPLHPDDVIAWVRGPMRSILTAERVMLNFLQHMSGVASLTRQYVDKLREAGSDIEVVDTRKTTPIWRKLEKYAVRVGGGGNHRYALYDMYLVKNNHIDAAGGIRAVLERIGKHNAKSRLKVAVEARNLDEVEEILDCGADLIMLDNMSTDDIKKAADLIGDAAMTEITGGVQLDTIAQYADLPVNRISIGALTHSAPALDISLHVEQVEENQQ
ncbi:MAG: carboxylating nicotinate-nucleotide diphosphorylase [Candidatus Sumerlaeia bacterium]